MWRMAHQTLNSERIVSAAIELLDDEGLAGLNMRALGDRLGAAATAVYWHVQSKSNLIVLAGDQVWNEIALPELDNVDWREAATLMATELHSMLIRHPWLVQVFGTHPLYGPGKARHDDHSLAVYEAAGFSSEEADQAATAVFTFVLGSALGQAASTAFRMAARRRGRDPDVLAGEAVARAREVALRFPRLAARLDVAAAEYLASPENTFEFGLAAIMDGLEAHIATRRSGADVGTRGADPSAGGVT